MKIVKLAVAATVLLVTGAVASAQAPVTAADLTRLDAAAVQVDSQIQVLARTDKTLAAESARTLLELRDEIAYLRVKFRREGTLARTEYTDVHDRLETLRAKTAGGARVAAQPLLTGDPQVFMVPVGTELDVRLQTPLTSRTARLEQRFEATTVVDFPIGKDVAIPAGSLVRGFVSSVRPAGRVDRTGRLTLSFDELVVDGRVSRLRASVVKALDPKLTEDVNRIGAGAVVGAVIGGILGGGKGALLGVLIGGGGTIASTEGSDVDLPVGTVLRIRVDQPVEVQR